MSSDSTPASTASSARPPRILAVDALRGFDMFWIIGGARVAKALEPFSDGPVMQSVKSQLEHEEWAGFRFYDGIFPLFLFLIGVSIVLSMDRLLASAGRGGAMARIIRRGVLLFALGVFYYGGVTLKWPDITLSGVLPRLALCYFFGALLYVWLPRRGIIIAAAAGLLGYWALLMFVPYPDIDVKHEHLSKKDSQAGIKPVAGLLAAAPGTTHGGLEEGRNLVHYVDAVWLPGRKLNGYYSNEGLLSTIPAVVTVLLGIMAGWWIGREDVGGGKKAAWLLGAGAAAMALGFLWGLQFPVIKRLWTSSYCLVSGGFAAMMLGVFYYLVEVWQWRRGLQPLLWIGSNALVVYLAVNVLDCGALAERLAGGDVRAFLDARLTPGAGGVVIAAIALAVPVLLARFLFRRGIFIRL